MCHKTEKLIADKESTLSTKGTELDQLVHIYSQVSNHASVHFKEKGERNVMPTKWGPQRILKKKVASVPAEKENVLSTMESEVEPYVHVYSCAGTCTLIHTENQVKENARPPEWS